MSAGLREDEEELLDVYDELSSPQRAAVLVLLKAVPLSADFAARFEALAARGNRFVHMQERSRVTREEKGSHEHL